MCASPIPHAAVIAIRSGAGAVALMGAHLRHPAMAWQQLAGEHLFATTSSGERWAHRIGVVSVARQNGKSLLLTALGLWSILEWPALAGRPITTVLVSRDLRLAARMFEVIGAVLDDQQRVRKVSWSYGRQRLVCHDGSELLIQASTPGCGHGLAADFCIVDEAWDVSATSIEDGLLPTMRARPDPLLVMASTAGDDGSEFLVRWRDRGIALAEGDIPAETALVEWSSEPGAEGPEAWRAANPALGATISEATLELEAKAPNHLAYRRAALNQWVASAVAWITPEEWADCTRRDSTVETAQSRGGWLAVEVDPKGQEYVGLRAWRLEDGRCAVATALHEITEDGMWTAVLKLMDGDRTLRLAIAASLESHLPPVLKERSTTVGWRELGAWTTTARDRILAGGIVHGGETILDAHILRAVASKNERGMQLSTHRSPGPIGYARCLVWATNLAMVPRSRVKAALGVG